MKAIEDILSAKFSFPQNESVLKEFLKYEFYFLSSTKSLNPNKFLPETAITFLEMQSYFPYPMIFTQCLFTSLSSRRNQIIQIDDYISGFLSIYTGTYEKRIKFIFNMFNVNKDNLIHYEDVKQVLSYCHIFNKKQNLEALIKIIDSFFQTKKEYNRNEFTEMTIKENSDLFFVILSIIFEGKTFTNELLNLIKDDDTCLPYTKNDGANSPMISKKYSKFITGISEHNNFCDSKLSNINASNNEVNKGIPIMTPKYQIADKVKLPMQECSTYLLSNFKIDLESSKLKNEDEDRTTKNMYYNNQNLLKYCQSPELKKKSNILSINSLPFNKEGINRNYTFMKNSLLLKSYSNKKKSNKVIKEIKECEQLENKEIIVGSSNNKSIEETNEIIVICPDKVTGTIISNKKEDDLDEEDKELLELNNFEKDFIKAKNDLQNLSIYLSHINPPKFGSNGHILENGVFISKMESNNSQIYENSSTWSICLSNEVSKKNSIIKNGVNRLSSFCSGGIDRGVKKNNNSSSLSPKINNCNNSFSDYLTYPRIVNDYEEDIYLINNRETKMKIYTLYLCKSYHFMIIVRKKNVSISNMMESNSGNLNKENKFLEIKYLIPLRKLFIKTVNEEFEFQGKKYYQVNLVNTSTYKRMKYKIYFDKANSGQFIKFKSLLAQLTNYTRIQENFSTVKEIGKGSFGQMLLMKHKKSNRLYAVKKISKKVYSEEAFVSLNWERDIEGFLMNYNNSDHVLKCYKIIETLDHIYFVTDYIKNGSLTNYLRKLTTCLPSTSVLKLVRQIAVGISELHSYGIIHRDLKFENLLMDYETDIDDYTVKIIDFGLSKVITPLRTADEPYGTLLFSSPEILLNIPYNFKVDSWSLGIIVYYLEYAYMPFKIKGKEKNKEIMNKIVFNNLDMPDKEEYISIDDSKAHKCLVDIMTLCLNKDIKQRANVNKILSIINKKMNL